MRKIAMIAARPLVYQTRHLVPGEPFECSLGYSIIAQRKGMAITAAQAEAHAMREAAADPVRRRYQRRELTADHG